MKHWKYWTVQRTLVVCEVKRVVTGKLLSFSGGCGSMLTPSAVGTETVKLHRKQAWLSGFMAFRDSFCMLLAIKVLLLNV